MPSLWRCQLRSDTAARSEQKMTCKYATMVVRASCYAGSATGPPGGCDVEVSNDMRNCFDGWRVRAFAWADGVNTKSPVPPTFRFPAGAEITFQWNYTCRDSKPCAFSCGTADRVTALTIYLGTIPIGGNQRNSVIFYFYSTATIPYSDGFRINGGPASTLSCDVSGMTLDYSGPPTGVPMPPGGTSNAK